jgi:hypothetical protein
MKRASLNIELFPLATSVYAERVDLAQKLAKKKAR